MTVSGQGEKRSHARPPTAKSRPSVTGGHCASRTTRWYPPRWYGPL